MALSFVEKLKAMKLTSFKFSSFERSVTVNDDGTKVIYLTLELETPLAKVTSTNSEYDPSTGERIHPIITDVTSVRCNLGTIEKYESEFVFDEDKDGAFVGSGTYEGDLFFDLAKSSMLVWLTDVKFSKMSSDWKAEKRNERLSRFRKLGLES